MPGYTPKSSDVLERFLRYVQVDSQSDPHNEDETPSTACPAAFSPSSWPEATQSRCSAALARLRHPQTTLAP